MGWLTNLKIRKKLLLAFSVFISLMIILTIYSAVQFISITGAYHNLTESAAKRQTDLADALGNLALLRLNNISTAYPDTDNAISQSLVYTRRLDYELLCNTFVGHLDTYHGRLTNDNIMNPRIKLYRLGYINRIKLLFLDFFKPCYYKINEGTLESDNIKVSEGLLEEYNAATELTTLLNDLREMTVDYVETESARLSAYARRLAYTQFLVSAGLIILSIFVAVFMAKKIEMPIYKLEIAATEIAAGNLNYPIRSDSKDELHSFQPYRRYG